MKHTNLLLTALLINLLSFGNLTGLSAQTTSAPKQQGDFIENMSYNQTGKRDLERTFQYQPEGEDFVSINGKNRYTRALYGSHTAFRIETSDRPVFAAYNKKPADSRNISFRIVIAANDVALDSADYCKSVYKPGRRDYELSDKRFGNAALKISVQAFYDTEGGIWKIDATDFPENTKIVCELSEIKRSKYQRDGDIGTDPRDVFDAGKLLKSFEILLKNQTNYIVFDNTDLFQIEKSEGEKLYNDAEIARLKIANSLKINTPDPYLNTLGGTVAMAADGIWDGQTWLHGAIGWRMQLTGWRAAYTGDALGWHEQTRRHFDGFAASQVTDVEPTAPHPNQDEKLHLARAVEKMGTQMFSNGYICRSPNQTNRPHHYNMNLVYIDELLWHLNWTGDLDYARKIFPVIKLHLQWEKRNFDPDNDGLYDAYCCIWASDALQYNSGGVTHSSAYNYRANRMAAEIAEVLGENPNPYKDEAEKIKKAINEKLWLADKGWWAEYVDFMGNKLVHPNPAIWTIYHAIDSETGDIFQNYQATRYIDEYIPHIPIKIKNGGDFIPIPENLSMISTSSWLPYSWSLNNVAFAEVAHTALAYWQAGRPDEATNLFKAAVLDGMYLGSSPANIGQISFYDAARGESYRDFGDPVGVYSRAVVQGLFGIQPDLLYNRVVVRPGFPKDWNFAEMQHNDIDFKFERNGLISNYLIKNKFHQSIRHSRESGNPLAQQGIAGQARNDGTRATVILQIPARYENIQSLKINGKTAKWIVKENIEFPLIEIDCSNAANLEIKIEWKGIKIENQKKHYDTAEISRITNGKAEFKQNGIGKMQWWMPVDIGTQQQSKNYAKFTDIQGIAGQARNDGYVEVNIDKALNAAVTDIFKNQYLTPRSPYTTLQTPWQGIGEWCHPLLTYEIDDSGLRAAVKNETFMANEIPFRIPNQQKNIAFTTLWDNYPDSLSIALSGKAQSAVLLMAGTTNAMQYGIPSGSVTVTYKDGTNEILPLINPDTWCPIEQDFYTDGAAFKIETPRPYRVAFKTGIVSRDMETTMKVKPDEVYGRIIDGGAGIILNIPLDKNKELRSLQVKSIANEVIIGLMAVTLVK
ncbi:MAG: DUF4450 domain-containing protein [Paludibacter sp.]|jgi:hypothetical protein|nr:DUF4450 domain-containing protein [Paludibacter sp.]